MSTVAESNGQALAVLSSGERPWPTGRHPIDRAAVEQAARALLAALGADLGNNGLRDTPQRMADTYAELLTPEPFSLTTFPNDEGYDELVSCARSLSTRCACTTCCRSTASRTSATCPRSGSSASRSWRGWSSCSPGDLQLQERLTTQIAGWL